MASDPHTIPTEGHTMASDPHTIPTEGHAMASDQHKKAPKMPEGDCWWEVTRLIQRDGYFLSEPRTHGWYISLHTIPKLINPTAETLDFNKNYILLIAQES